MLKVPLISRSEYSVLTIPAKFCARSILWALEFRASKLGSFPITVGVGR